MLEAFYHLSIFLNNTHESSQNPRIQRLSVTLLSGWLVKKRGVVNSDGKINVTGKNFRFDSDLTTDIKTPKSAQLFLQTESIKAQKIKEEQKDGKSWKLVKRVFVYNRIINTEQ